MNKAKTQQKAFPHVVDIEFLTIDVSRKHTDLTRRHLPTLHLTPPQACLCFCLNLAHHTATQMRSGLFHGQAPLFCYICSKMFLQAVVLTYLEIYGLWESREIRQGASKERLTWAKALYELASLQMWNYHPSTETTSQFQQAALIRYPPPEL